MTENHQQQNPVLPQNQNVERKTINFGSTQDSKEGRWNEDQNIKYCLFVSYNVSKFQCKKKRLFRLYKPMSRFVTTRTSQQCRSHHRKLLQRFKTPRNIVKNLQKQLKNFSLLEKTEQYKQELKNILIPIKKSQRHNYQRADQSFQNQLSQKQEDNRENIQFKTKSEVQSQLPVIPVPHVQLYSNINQMRQQYQNTISWNYYAPQLYWNYFYSQNMPGAFYN